jgi:hypothetical protein
MLRETILQLSKAAEARKPALLVKIAQTLPPGIAPIGTRQDYQRPAEKAVEQREFADKVQKQVSEALDTTTDSARMNSLRGPLDVDLPGADPAAPAGSYGKAIGYGAGAGALAGIPIALLARALFSRDEEDSDLPSYLMTALKGALIGGGVGGLAGAGLRGAYGTEGGKTMIDKGLGYLPQSAQDFTKNVLG